MSKSKKIAAFFTMCAVTTSFLYPAGNTKVVKADTIVKDYSNVDAKYYVVEDENKFEFLVYDNNVVLGKYNGNESEVLIPSEYKGLAVTEILSSAFMENKTLSKVTIPSSIKTIDNSAFRGCTSLKEVSLSEGLEYIGEMSFLGCSSLENINLPNSLKEIENSAFRDCSLLKNITIPLGVDNIGDTVFSRCISLTEINVSEDNEYYSSEDGILYSKYKSELVACPLNYKTDVVRVNKDTKRINDGAFSGCSKLKGVILPENLETIGSNAFSSCYSLSEINMPDTVKYLGYSVFYNCKNLKSVKLSSNITEIEPGTFDKCISLKNLSIPEGVKKISVGAFDECISLESVVVPKSVDEIQAAFQGLDNIIVIGEKESFIETYCKEMNITFKELGVSDNSDNDVSVSNDTSTPVKEESNVVVTPPDTSKVEVNSNENNTINKVEEIKDEEKPKNNIQEQTIGKNVNTGESNSVFTSIFLMMLSLVGMLGCKIKSIKNKI